MSSKLIPANPEEVMVVRNVTPNIVTLSVPFARAGVLNIGGRGTIVRMTSGTLLVFSPVALTATVKAKVAEMGGNVGYIVAGDIEHHIFITEWAKEWPNAKIIGPDGLPQKRAKMNDPKIGKDEKFYVLTPQNYKEPISEEFAADFELEYMEAHPNKEVILLFKPEKTLIQADLMFNLPANEQYSKVSEAQKRGGFASRLWASMLSTSGDAKSSKRFYWYALSVKNRAGWHETTSRIDQWDFDRIIPCHGDVIETGAKAVFEKVFEWHIKGHK